MRGFSYVIVRLRELPLDGSKDLHIEGEGGFDRLGGGPYFSYLSARGYPEDLPVAARDAVIVRVGDRWLVVLEYSPSYDDARLATVRGRSALADNRESLTVRGNPELLTDRPSST